MAMTRSHLIGLLFLMAPLVSHALTGPETLIRMPRQMAMGGVGVGLADDEYALFMNPAGLAGQVSRKFHAVALGAEASADTYTSLSTVMSGLNNFQLSTLNSLMGKDIYTRASFSPMIKLPHFAISFVGDVQGALLLTNQSNPTYTLGEMATYGFQAGMGWTLKSGRRPVDEFRFGLSGKMLWRRGGYYDLSTAGFLQLTSEGRPYVDRLVGSYGFGYGADAGAQYVRHIDKNTDLFAGASVTDIAGTRFNVSTARVLPMNPSLGFGITKTVDLLKFKAGIDLQNLDQDLCFSNKVHIGMETSIPLIDLYAGLNQLNFTYGAAFDIWILRVTALSYAEELGVAFHQNTSRRYMLQVDFNLPI